MSGGGGGAVLPVTCSSPPLQSGQCIRVLVGASPLGLQHVQGSEVVQEKQWKKKKM